jgi:predicted DNA-binding transcriptional regulator YafY
MEFIDWRLRWEGRINRSDLTAFFGISVPQASLDIARYIELAPDNTRYDRSNKVYVASETFQALYPGTTPERYLNELLARCAGVLQPELGFSGWTPPMDMPANPARSVDSGTLLTLLSAIHNAKRVDVSYQSMSAAMPEERQISPHALGYDGFRWHVRAYCHSRSSHRDFVIARVLHASPTQVDALSPDADAAWHRRVDLVIGPNPALSPGTKRVIELDYAMRAGQVTISCRQALLFYTLKRLGLLPGQEAPPEVQQLALINRDDVQVFLPQAT